MNQTWVSSSMAATITIGFFLWRNLKKFEVWDRNNNTKELRCSSACYCTSVDTALLQCMDSSIPWYAQTCFDMHGGHFEHLPL
ncbi:hypothetical protein TNCV_2746521 [Trichonephila clavipes]|nr:hypothetical protein TNCV_2746521 [Trichonephila clavipes]